MYPYCLPGYQCCPVLLCYPTLSPCAPIPQEMSATPTAPPPVATSASSPILQSQVHAQKATIPTSLPPQMHVQDARSPSFPQIVQNIMDHKPSASPRVPQTQPPIQVTTPPSPRQHSQGSQSIIRAGGHHLYAPFHDSSVLTSKLGDPIAESSALPPADPWVPTSLKQLELEELKLILLNLPPNIDVESADRLMQVLMSYNEKRRNVLKLILYRALGQEGSTLPNMTSFEERERQNASSWYNVMNLSAGGRQQAREHLGMVQPRRREEMKDIAKRTKAAGITEVPITPAHFKAIEDQKTPPHMVSLVAEETTEDISNFL